jgi:magnesium transporter
MEKKTHYPRQTAGSRMTRSVPTASPETTIDELKKQLSQKGKEVDAMQYVYVLDDSGKLTGMLSMHDLFRASGSTRVGEACNRTNLHSVHPLTNQERAAYMALRHELKAVPVVDHDRTFLGAISSDVLLKILYETTHEDLMRRAGIGASHPMFDNVLTMPLRRSIMHRLPWLLIGLIGGLAAAKVVGFFEHTLEQNIVLAAFIPLIVYMSDAVGTQMEAFIIRDLAVDRHLKFGMYVLRQLLVVSAVGVVCSAFIYGATVVFYPASGLGLIIALALFAAILSSIVTGLLIPFLLSRFRADPANASGPIATIIQDLLSLVIYFTVATLMMR